MFLYEKVLAAIPKAEQTVEIKK